MHLQSLSYAFFDRSRSALAPFVVNAEPTFSNMTAALNHVFRLIIASRLFHNCQYKFDLCANIGASGQTHQSVQVPLEVKPRIIIGNLYRNGNMNHVEDCYRIM